MWRFWFGPRREPVKFVYLTGDQSQALEVKRLAEPGFELVAVESSVGTALEAAARTGARVVLTEAGPHGAGWRDVVAAARKHTPALAVVVVLDSFEGAEWAEIIRNRAYDVLLRPLRRESFTATLAGAEQSTAGVRRAPASGRT